MARGRELLPGQSEIKNQPLIVPTHHFKSDHASRCLPAFFAAAHLFFIAKASRFRASSLSLPRRERVRAAAVFGAVPVLAGFLAAAPRLFVASMILLRPSGLRRLFPDVRSRPPRTPVHPWWSLPIPRPRRLGAVLVGQMVLVEKLTAQQLRLRCPGGPNVADTS
jgi:hypothetical protein